MVVSLTIGVLVAIIDDVSLFHQIVEASYKVSAIVPHKICIVYDKHIHQQPTF